MKNKKWLKYTLGVLLTLLVLAGVAGAGFRAGMMQNVNFTRIENGARPSFTHDEFGGSRQSMQGGFHDNDKDGAMRENFQRQMPGNQRGFDRRDGGFFFTPVFWLIRLVVLGLLVWLGYKLVNRSGWRLSLTKASPVPTPATAVNNSSSVEVEEKKASE